MKNQADYGKLYQGSIKGILIGNPFCEEPPDNRPPKETNKHNFTSDLVKLAERHDISVIWTIDLFKLVCILLNDKIEETKKAELRARARHEIFTGKGLIRFSMLS